ncbi:MAG: PAS domain S-box protein, partial [Myxococcales bacterium]
GERLLERADGTRCSVHFTVFPVPIGRRTLAALMFCDVTERRLLEATQARLASVLDATPDMVVISTTDGVIIDSNEAARQQLWGGNQLNGITIDDIVPSHMRKRALAEILPQLVETGHWSGEVPWRTADGHELPVWMVVLVHQVGEDERLITAIARDMTEHKAAQQRLAEALALNQSIIGASNVGIAAYSESGRCVYANAALATMFGQSIDTMVNSSFLQEPFWKTSGMLPVALAVLATGLAQRAEFCLQQLEGAEAYLDIYFTRFVNAEEAHLLVVGNDISEQRRAVEARRESEERYRALLQNEGEGTATVDTQERIIRASAAAETIFGTVAGGLVGRCLKEFYPRVSSSSRDSDRARRRDWVRSVYEIQILHPSGQRRTLLTTATPQWGQDGSLVGSLLVFRDITERKAAETALRDSEERFRKLATHAPVGIFMTDTAGRCVFVNPGVCRISGLTENEALGQNWGRLVDPEMARQLEQTWIQAAVEGRQFLAEVRFKRPTGETVWAIVSAAATRAAIGDVTGFVGTLIDITERKLSEQRLCDSETTLRTLLDAESEAISLMEPDGTILVANEAFAKRKGKRLDEVLGKRALDLVSADIAERRGAYRERVVQSRQPLRYEDTIGDRSFLNSLHPILDAAGNVARIAVLSVDLSHQKRIERELKEKEHFVQRLVASTPNLLYIYDRVEQRTVYANRDFVEVFGEGIGDVRRSGVDQDLCWIHPDDTLRLQVHEERLRRAADDDVLELEYRVQSASGDWRWLLDREVVFARGSDGAPIQVLGTAQDITGRKQIEEALQESEERFRSITTSAHDAIMMVDDGGHVSYWNAAAQETFGFSATEILGQDLHLAMVPEAYRVRALEGLAEFRKTGHGSFVGKTLRLVAQRKDRVEIPIELSVSSVRLQGRWHAIGIARDVTARELAAKEMLRAKEAAEAASRAKSDFVANMSHEIRTPMNTVIGLGHLALQTELSPKQRDYLLKIQSSSKYLLSILNDILDFSKIEAGKLELETVPFDLDEVFETIANVAVSEASRKDLEVLFSVPVDVPRALIGDPLRLAQVLTNLTQNATKFTERGEIVISVRSAPGTRAEEAHLEFLVRDTGIGIHPEKLEQLFMAFQQADTSITRRYGGTGLGLAISRRLVGLMGGNIEVSSEPGKGSTFSFFAVFPRQSVASEPQLLSAGLEKLRALVADDNASSREILCAHLAAFGLHPYSVGSGQDALDELDRAALQDTPYDFVLLDWKMPDLDGLETAEQIQADPRLSKVPTVIMVSAYGQNEAVERAKALGIAAFLLKPVSPSALLDAILRAFHREGLPPRSECKPKSIFADGLALARGARVLVVEDQLTNRQVASELLEQAGLEVDLAEGGAEALDLAERGERYDAVFMDLQMPDLDGYETTRRLRMHLSYQSVPIIAMTADAMAGDREKCLEAGMNDHIAKPIDIEDLHAAVATWIRPSSPQIKQIVPAPIVSPVPSPLPSDLPGIDVEVGLRRVGSERLLIELIGRFGTDYGGTVPQVREALDHGKNAEAQRAVHS